MTFDLINPFMLVGLAALALPVIVHLLNRRKYDVTQWGAMQFLELGREARRRVHLEELLLLLLRMLMILLIVSVFLRPWVSGGFFGGWTTAPPRDVVLIVDGSYSMNVEENGITPHHTAIQTAHRLLERLSPNDSVALIDARKHATAVVSPATYDKDRVRAELDRLAAPAGSAEIPDAVTEAVHILSQTNHVSREIVLLTDLRAHGWHADDESLWSRIDDLRSFPTVRPNLWAVDVGPATGSRLVNFSVGRLALSRELTVTGFPLRISTKIRAYGNETTASREVYLEVDGQRLADQTRQVRLAPGGEASLEFEHRFSTTGSHLLRVILEPDSLADDNDSAAAITVMEGLPVLIVDGDPRADATRSESYFARLALTPPLNESPWVIARTVPALAFDEHHLADVNVAILANVVRLTAEQLTALEQFVRKGGGLLVACGDRIEAQAYQTSLFQNGHGLLPALLTEQESLKPPELAVVQVANESLQLRWLKDFRLESQGELPNVRFTRWWKCEPVFTPPEQPAQSPDGSEDASPVISPAMVLARLTTGDPLLVYRDYGNGRVMLMTAPLDADWSTLPAKPDFVPLLHEMVFSLADQNIRRNVDAGTPLIWELPEHLSAEDFEFHGPQETVYPAQPGREERRQVARLDTTELPGVYQAVAKTPQRLASGPEYFVVNADREESNLEPLSAEQIQSLAGNADPEQPPEDWRFLNNLDEWEGQLSAEQARVEIWPFILCGFLILLVSEVLLTRKLVHGTEP